VRNNLRTKHCVVVVTQFDQVSPLSAFPTRLSRLTPSLSLSLSLSTEFDRAKMSNRYSSNRQEGNKEGFGKTHKKFVPKNQSSSPKEPNPNPNSNPTLSTSLRQSLSKQSDGATASSSVEAPTTTRIRMGENGEWVSSGRAQGGNFVNYLPQDEAVAAGLNANEGGLDPVESQRVVDLLNRELSRLLKLSPRNFWTEGTAYYRCVF
jgi:activating signal cointegrator complex subunit 2